MKYGKFRKSLKRVSYKCVVLLANKSAAANEKRRIRNSAFWKGLALMSCPLCPRGERAVET